MATRDDVPDFGFERFQQGFVDQWSWGLTIVVSALESCDKCSNEKMQWLVRRLRQVTLFPGRFDCHECLGFKDRRFLSCLVMEVTMGNQRSPLTEEADRSPPIGGNPMRSLP
ncbi:hypothetical protein QYF36_013636 [Acer negundo]|nr:hypothetical protein QYF36_013636 [Acer negundo]